MNNTFRFISSICALGKKVTLSFDGLSKSSYHNMMDYFARQSIAKEVLMDVEIY